MKKEEAHDLGKIGPMEARMTVSEILTKCKHVLRQHYKSRFKGLVLYGSLARNEGQPGSDIDLLVLLSPPLDFFRELQKIVALLYPIQLESERLISARPASYDDFEQGTILLYRSAKREGIMV